MHSLDPLEEDGNSLAAADAGGADGELLVVLPQLVDEVGGDPGRGKTRVARRVNET